jgi:hypothetical protein
LLTPEATPAYRVGTAESAVEVNGATSVLSPRPKTVTAGSTSCRKVAEEEDGHRAGPGECGEPGVALTRADDGIRAGAEGGHRTPR